MVKFDGTTSSTYQMSGGGPRGTLLGVLEYLVQCNDCANCVRSDQRYLICGRSHNLRTLISYSLFWKSLILKGGRQKNCLLGIGDN